MQNPATQHTIPLDSVKLALEMCKVRKINSGRTAMLAAYTPAPVVQTDCSSRKRLRARALDVDLGMRNQAGLLERGHLHELIERTRLHHGLAEVRKTWGTGLRALLAEPRHTLNGGVQ